MKIESMKELNEKVTRVARVVVHPKYRTIGAGVKLMHDSLPLCGKPYVEMIAVMARYNPFAERGGMKKICESKPDKSILEAVAELGKNQQISLNQVVPAESRFRTGKSQDRDPKYNKSLCRFGSPCTRCGSNRA